MDDEKAHRVHAIQAMLQSPGWDAYLRAEIQERLDQVLYRTLAGRATQSEAARCSALGEAAALQWVLTWGSDQVQQFQLAVEEEIAEARAVDELEAKIDERLEGGHYSPYSEAQNPEG